MKIRYFQRADRPGIWMDFKDAQGVRQRVPTGQLTKEAAERVAPQILAEHLSKGPKSGTIADAGAIVLVAGPTFREAFDQGMRERGKWMQVKDKDGLEGTFDQLAAYWGEDTRLGTADRQAVLKWREAMTKEPGKRKGSTLSASTINHRLSMLSVLLEVANLPPHTVKHLSTKGTARHRRVPDAEFARMTEWAGEQVLLGRSGAVEFARLLPAGLDTGARLSELLDLPPRDITQATATFRDTKNGTTRTIPLRPMARRALLAGTGLRPFPTLNADRVTALWDLMRAAMGLREDHRFVFHLLRHECASRFADEGKGAHFIKQWMGHENISTSESYVNMSVGGLAQQIGVDLTEEIRPLEELSQIRAIIKAPKPCP